MKRKYRIKTIKENVSGLLGVTILPIYCVQVHTWCGIWVTIKEFEDITDFDFARREAEELLDHLNEK